MRVNQSRCPKKYFGIPAFFIYTLQNFNIITLSIKDLIQDIIDAMDELSIVYNSYDIIKCINSSLNKSEI